MTKLDYLNFDLLVEKAEGTFRVRLLDSPAGQTSLEFKYPFERFELENFFLRMGRARNVSRGLDSEETTAAKEIGARLFENVFDDELLACYRSSLLEAERLSKGLRVRLRLKDAPELADLPWEYLYERVTNRFLVLSKTTPIVRYLELAEAIKPLVVTPPLRMLVMISSPSDAQPLNTSAELSKLRGALDGLIRRGLIKLHVLENATLASLRRALRDDSFHIFHFMGHGGFEEAAQEGILMLESQSGHGHRVSGQMLGTILSDSRSMRLVVLNACEGARESREDPFAGVAQSLVQRGIPAVIAMQFEVTDRAAIVFSEELYASLACGYPVDAAVGEARRAIFAEDNAVEWGSPVLHMRSSDGKIFAIEDGDVAPLPPPWWKTAVARVAAACIAVALGVGLALWLIRPAGTPLTLQLNPADAAVHIDSSAVAPGEATSLSSGTHTLAVTAPGYYGELRTVEAGEEPIVEAFTLQPTSLPSGSDLNAFRDFDKTILDAVDASDLRRLDFSPVQDRSLRQILELRRSRALGSSEAEVVEQELLALARAGDVRSSFSLLLANLVSDRESSNEIIDLTTVAADEGDALANFGLSMIAQANENEFERCRRRAMAISLGFELADEVLQNCP